MSKAIDSTRAPQASNYPERAGEVPDRPEAMRRREDANRRPDRTESSGPPLTARALQGEGGVGGRSGTGQAGPHRGFDDRSGADALGQPVDEDAELPMAASGPTYQSGGTGLDREQLDEERKTRESGGGAPRSPDGAADPPPGAPVNRNRP